MSKIHWVTSTSLNRAVGRVQVELDRFGLWTDPVQEIDIWLVPAGIAFGWKWDGRDGQINIPAASWDRLSGLWGGSYVSLADVLRHEYAHAVADLYPGLSRSKRFRAAFGASYNDESEFEYDLECHVSEYAATNASEDFAEVFMLFLRHKGRLPAQHGFPTIQEKWDFVRQLTRAIKAGRRRW